MDNQKSRYGDVCDGCLARPDVDVMAFRIDIHGKASEPIFSTAPGQRCDMCGEVSRVLTSASFGDALYAFEAWCDQLLAELEGV